MDIRHLPPFISAVIALARWEAIRQSCSEYHERVPSSSPHCLAGALCMAHAVRSQSLVTT